MALGKKIALIKKSEVIGDVYRSLMQRPLAIDELDVFYRATSEARGKNPRSRIARLLEANLDTDEHILFVGYRGCGKSTELNHLQKDIQDDFLVFNFSIFEELDPNSINYIEIFIVTMERLFAFVEQQGLDISKEYLASITNFLKTKEIEDVREKYLGADVEVGSETTFTIPYIQKFFAKFKASAKASRSLKTVLKENVEPHFPALIENCNALINEIRLKLGELNKKDIAIIIEDLDKIYLSEAKDLFFDHANQITRLKTNVVYTFPIALYHDLQFNSIKGYFSNIYELPMIKITDKTGKLEQEGYNALRAIVEARMNLNLFEQSAILDKMIKYSGGCLRDLFSMITEASESAMDENRPKINDADWQNAFQRIKNEYEHTIADYVEDGKVIYKASDYFKVLVDLAKSTTKKPDNTQVAMQLRQNLCILGYNGEGWCDVHPIVKEILKEREIL